MTFLLPAVSSGSPLLDRLHHCSAKTLIEALPDASIDLIATDPPYGIGYKSGWKTTNGHKPRVFTDAFGKDELDTSWIVNAARVLKPDGAFYLCTRWDVLHHWMSALEESGLKVVERIMWDKLNWGAGNLKYYGSQVEDILFCVKGSHALRWKKREGNVWRLTKLDAINNEGNYDNPTQKPESLFRRIITRSSDPGDIVLDPFVGSGTCAAAARKMGRFFIACDISPYQYQIAQKRLQLDFPTPLFHEV